MMNNAPSGAKKHCESTELESHQTAKMFFFDVERYVGWSCILNCFMPILFLCFLLICYPYILLHFYVFLLLYSYTLIEDSIVSMLLRSTECTRAGTIYQYINISQY